MSFGGTKLPTSISGTPAAAIAAIQAIFFRVSMMDFAICRPSRGPTSQIVTFSFIACILYPGAGRNWPSRADRASGAG